MASLYAAEPEMISELAALVQADLPGLKGLRALAVRVLAVQVQVGCVWCVPGRALACRASAGGLHECAWPSAC